MNENTTSVDLPLPPAKQRAQRRRAAADATAKWRAMRRAVGMPEAAHVDRALAEAVTFCLQPAYATTDGTGVHISLDRLFRVAVLVLMRDGADRVLAQDAIRERLHPREAHTATGFVPSLNMHVPGFVPNPRRGDVEWSIADRNAMKAASRPRDHAV